MEKNKIKTRFSPIPWEVDDQLETIIYIRDADGGIIAELALYDEAPADARLMSAAFEMLQACWLAIEVATPEFSDDKKHIINWKISTGALDKMISACHKAHVRRVLQREKLEYALVCECGADADPAAHGTGGAICAGCGRPYKEKVLKASAGLSIEPAGGKVERFLNPLTLPRGEYILPDKGGDDK